MQLGLSTLFQFFTERVARNLILATVVKTLGPTYRKAGAMILLDANGQHSGLLSGGCLEADLGEHARKTLTDGQSSLVHYDLGLDESTAPWSLGLGCGGSMSILLEPVDTPSTLDALHQLHSLWQCGHYCEVRKTVRRSNTAFLCSNSVLQVKPQSSPDHDARQISVLPDLASLDDGGEAVMHIPVSPQRRLYIAGAGPDAVPLAAMATTLGWYVAVFDPRQEYLSQENFPSAAKLVLKQPQDLGPEDMPDPQAIVIMTHNLDRDRSFLELSLALPFKYIGLLGPVSRRQALLSELGYGSDDRVFGPAGLDLDCVLPEDIALSVLAEVSAVLNGASAQSLSHLDKDIVA